MLYCNDILNKDFQYLDFKSDKAGDIFPLGAEHNKVFQKHNSSMKLDFKTISNIEKRSSDHVASDKFKTNNRGSILPNLIAKANINREEYVNIYKENNLIINPASIS